MKLSNILPILSHISLPRLSHRTCCQRQHHRHIPQQDRQYHEHSGKHKTWYSRRIPSALALGSLFGLMFGSRKDDLKKSIGCATMHLHQAEPHLAAPFFQTGFNALHKELNRERGDPVPDKEIVFLMDQLGNIALQLELYTEAVQLYTATIEGLVLHGTARNDRMITELSLKVAQIHAINGDNKLAELGFMHCVVVTNAELSSNTGPKNLATVSLAGLAYEGLGKLYIAMNQPDQALCMYKYAIDFAEKVLVSTDANLPVLYGDVAAVYESMDRLDEALEMIQQAEVHEQRQTPFYSHRVSIKRARLLAKMGHVLEAELLYDELKILCVERGDLEMLREVDDGLKIIEERKSAK